MDFIFIIMILVFVIIPWVNKSKEKKGKKNNWGQSHAQIKNKYGHSGASNMAHKRLHSSDSSSAFPEGHKEHVQARDIRDAQENRKMEQTIHSHKNVGIVRAQNKGRSDWGTRGDKTSFTGLIVIIILAVLLYFLATTAF
ncbi:MAG: hypothetical protein JKX72_11300 [Robiginitomaculum sp.]|nr:hypothetical protein [Robiginitomaculum sp.]